MHVATRKLLCNWMMVYRRVAELETELKSVVNSMSSGVSDSNHQHVIICLFLYVYNAYV